MAGRTGYTAPTNSDAPEGPAQMTAVYQHFDALVDPFVNAVVDLPASGNWDGRTIYVKTTGEFYVWDGSAWDALGVSDSGWVNITTLGANWSATVGHQPRVRRIGKHVFLHGAVTFATGGSADNLATIPVGFRPTGTHAQVFIGAGTTNKGNNYVLYTPSGDPSKIAIPIGYASAGFSAPEVVPFIGSWFID